MNFIKKFFNQTNLKPNLKPLNFSPLAIQKILEHLQSQSSKNIISSFQIKVIYKKQKYIVQVGFDKLVEQKTLFKYPIPLLISAKDELFLRGFKLDFHEGEKAFFVYPNVEVEATDTPRKNIIRFFTNKYLISPNSTNPELILERNGYTNFEDIYFLNTIFRHDFVESIFVKENWIQVEFSNSTNLRQAEQQIGTALVEYLELCSYPLIVEKDTIFEEYLTS